MIQVEVALIEFIECHPELWQLIFISLRIDRLCIAPQVAHLPSNIGRLLFGQAPHIDICELSRLH